MNGVLEAVGGKVSGGRALTFDDVQALAGVSDLVRLGMLADEARRRRHGARVTFVRVADVTCGEAATAAWPATAGEIRLVGTPASVDEAIGQARALAARANGTPVSAFALHDLERLAGDARALTHVVDRLEECGVAAIAEAPLDLLRDREAALQAVRDAGLPIARVTIRRGRTTTEALPLLRDVKALQKHTGNIRVFAPLPRDIDAQQASTGYDDVRVVALARLWLDNVESIQVDWALYGPKLAQVSLLFGVDDIDSVSAADLLDQGRRRAPLEEVRRNITAAGLSPVERTGRWAVAQA
jgi:aminodeoxyfutalosine synthase